MAQEMETTPEFIASMKKDLRDPKKPHWSQFACYARPDFTTACLRHVDFYTIEKFPRMTEAEHQTFLMRNKGRLTAPRSPPTGTPRDDKPQAQKLPVERHDAVYCDSKSGMTQKAPDAPMPELAPARPAKRDEHDPGEPSDTW